MVCPNCQIPAKKFGKDRKGVQRFRRYGCKKDILRDPGSPARYQCTRRERITGVEKKTILALLERVGDRCDMLFENSSEMFPSETFNVMSCGPSCK